MAVILDTQRHEYSLGKYSEGFKVLIHKQGEYFDEREGINIGPGQHVVVALTQKRVGIIKQIIFFFHFRIKRAECVTFKRVETLISDTNATNLGRQFMLDIQCCDV